MGIPDQTTAADLDRYSGIHSTSLAELERLHHDRGLSLRELGERLNTDPAAISARLGKADIERYCGACGDAMSGVRKDVNYCSEQCRKVDNGDAVVCPDCGEKIRAVGRWVHHRDRAGQDSEILEKTSQYDESADVSWRAQRQAALHNAAGECEICGSTDGLDVHHLIKRRYFESEDRSHALENLAVLCRGCHSIHENSGARTVLEAVVHD